MKRAITILFVLSVLASGCRHSMRDRLIGRWHGVKLENPAMDSFDAKNRVYIDTVGKGHDAATNMRLYGVTNTDSMRNDLKRQYDDAKAMQENTVLNTIFDFRKDSIVTLYFNGSLDSSKWYLEGDQWVVMDELNGTGAGDVIKMEIAALSDTVLKLKFAENNSITTVTFHPERK